MSENSEVKPEEKDWWVLHEVKTYRGRRVVLYTETPYTEIEALRIVNKKSISELSFYTAKTEPDTWFVVKTEAYMKKVVEVSKSLHSE
jgi:hypothetical protein